jgi:phage baseplate assembly protein W
MPSTLTRPLAFDGRGRLARATGREALVARVETLIDTLPGEVEMEPELGSACRLRRHEPGDETLAADLREDVADAIARWEPTLQPRGATVTHAGHTTTMTAVFAARLTGQVDEARVEL